MSLVTWEDYILDDVLYPVSAVNSYIKEDYANRYFVVYSTFYSKWIGYSDQNKINRIVFASKSLDRMFEYKGRKYDLSNSFEFPRDIGREEEYPCDVVHPKVKDAVCEMIMLLEQEVDATTGQVEDKEQSEVEVLNGLARVKYINRTGSSKLKAASGGNIATIRSIMRPYIRGNRIVR